MSASEFLGRNATNFIAFAQREQSLTNSIENLLERIEAANSEKLTPENIATLRDIEKSIVDIAKSGAISQETPLILLQRFNRSHDYADAIQSLKTFIHDAGINNGVYILEMNDLNAKIDALKDIGRILADSVNELYPSESASLTDEIEPQGELHQAQTTDRPERFMSKEEFFESFGPRVIELFHNDGAIADATVSVMDTIERGIKPNSEQAEIFALLKERIIDDINSFPASASLGGIGGAVIYPERAEMYKESLEKLSIFLNSNNRSNDMLDFTIGRIQLGVATFKNNADYIVGILKTNRLLNDISTPAPLRAQLSFAL